MVVVRELRYEDMPQAINIKILCWPEEINGLSDLQLDAAAELDFWTKWMAAADANNDIRILLGAFSDDGMLGVAFGSFIESKDRPEDGFELNGLWVHPQHRGKGISLLLLRRLLDDFRRHGANKIAIYSFHHSLSNTYYRKFGCTVIDTEYQTADHVPVDVFACDIGELDKNLIQALASCAK